MNRRAPNSQGYYDPVTHQWVNAKLIKNSKIPIISHRRSAQDAGRTRQYNKPTNAGDVYDYKAARRRKMAFLVIVILTMVIGWVAITTLANWWQVTQDDWHYGRPRTYQVDQAVGHNDSATNPSHFIALNLNRHIQVIEFPGNDSSKAKVYIGPTLIGQNVELAVVTLSFKDVNGDGRLDMIVNIQDSHIVFINENGQFRPARPGENINLT